MSNYPDNMSRSDLIHVGEIEPEFGRDYVEAYCQICEEPILHNEETFGEYDIHNDCVVETIKQEAVSFVKDNMDEFIKYMGWK